MGTFNVNGKFPSQDLSAWVRGEVARPPAAFIPPLKEISPLSLGESQKKLGDETPGEPLFTSDWCLIALSLVLTSSHSASCRGPWQRPAPQRHLDRDWVALRSVRGDDLCEYLGGCTICRDCCCFRCPAGRP